MIVTLIIATVGVTVSVLGLEPHARSHLPPLMIVRPDRAPVRWHGWQLIPPAEDGSCERDAYDICKDGQEDYGDPTDLDEDNEPSLI